MLQDPSGSLVYIGMFVLIHLGIVYFLVVRGLKSLADWGWVVIVMYGYLLLMSTLTDVNIRFRVPLMPGFLILAGLGVKK